MEEQRQEIGNGFSIPKSDCKYFRKHKLLGGGLLSFLNKLSDILVLEEKTMPQKEWLSLKVTLLNLMSAHRDGSLLYSLLENHNPDEIHYNTYQLFYFHQDFPVKVSIFKVIPTEHLEEFTHSQGKKLFRSMEADQVEEFMKAIERRDDSYGGLPREFVHEILMPEAHIPKDFVYLRNLPQGVLDPFRPLNVFHTLKI